MKEKIKLIMAEILDVEANTIDDKFSPNTAANWDSLNNLRLITALESEFDIQLTMNDIEEMVDYSYIVQTISSYLD